MTLKKGTSNEVIAENVAELVRSGRPVEQAAAIAYKAATGEDKAAGIMYRCGDSVLLLNRAPDAGDYPGHWCFPAGGIEPGETPEQAAIRESAEEIGYTPDGALTVLDWDNGFTTFALDLPEKITPVLNGEHVGYLWAPINALPQPMHPGCAATLGALPAPMIGMDKREYDGNGWFEVKANPISKAGIFPYSGRQLGLTGPDADRIFQVLRPPEELSDPECIESFRLIPWVDDHTMIGPAAQEITDSAQPAEKKGIHGVIGEEVFFKDGTLFANIKAFSSTLAQLIQAGKRELSAGYRCIYDMTSGIWNGQRYDAVQRKIRGNHLALVNEGRMGPDVAVMDRLTFTFDAKELEMADENQSGEGGQVDLAAIVKQLETIAPQVQQLMSFMAKLKPLEEAEHSETLDNKPAPAEGAAPNPNPAEKPEDTAKEPAAASMDAAEFERQILGRIAKRDALASKLSKHIGTFDHAEKTLDEVVKYGCDKLGIKAEKGQEAAVLAGFLQASHAAVPPAAVNGMDAAPASAGNFITRHLKGA